MRKVVFKKNKKKKTLTLSQHTLQIKKSQKCDFKGVKRLNLNRLTHDAC